MRSRPLVTYMYTHVIPLVNYMYIHVMWCLIESCVICIYIAFLFEIQLPLCNFVAMNLSLTCV